MRILADENIPLLDEFFAPLGSLVRRPGRGIARAEVAEAEVLLVRSVTRVDRALLEGTPVRFVGTCTIGTDHLDIAYLEQAGIAWSSAPGCNARGVVEYVLGALLSLAEASSTDLSQRCYGVVGAGEVGGRLVEVLRGLGWQVLVCDPPRQARGEQGLVSLEQIIEQCDVISLHTPLTRQGDEATWHLFDLPRLQRLRPGAWLINASRGAVVDNHALYQHLQAGADLRVVLDVWEGEPQVDVALAGLCHLATPHIAGYSLDGKLRGTAQIYQAYCASNGLEPHVALTSLMPAAWLTQVHLAAGTPEQWALSKLCRSIYDPRDDDARFRQSLQGDSDQRRTAFDRLRRDYPLRRELTGLQVAVGGDARLARLVTALGARVLDRPAQVLG